MGDRALLVTLDSLKVSRISFIKIDVEGYENQVLDGAVETIKRDRPTILCEILGGVSFEEASPAQKDTIKNTLAKFKMWNYNVMRVGVSDYLAVPLVNKYM